MERLVAIFCKVFEIGDDNQMLIKQAMSDKDENGQTWPCIEFWTFYKSACLMTMEVFRCDELKHRETKSWEAMQERFNTFDQLAAHLKRNEIVSEFIAAVKEQSSMHHSLQGKA